MRKNAVNFKIVYLMLWTKRYGNTRNHSTFFPKLCSQLEDSFTDANTRAQQMISHWNSSMLYVCNSRGCLYLISNKHMHKSTIHSRARTHITHYQSIDRMTCDSSIKSNDKISSSRVRKRDKIYLKRANNAQYWNSWDKSNWPRFSICKHIHFTRLKHSVWPYQLTKNDNDKICW